LARPAVQGRLGLGALESARQGEDGRVPVTHAGMSETDRHVTLSSTSIETREYLQLIQLVRTAIELTVDVRQFLACGDERRREQHGLLERLQCVGGAMLVTQAHAEQVVRVG